MRKLNHKITNHHHDSWLFWANRRWVGCWRIQNTLYWSREQVKIGINLFKLWYTSCRIQGFLYDSNRLRLLAVAHTWVMRGNDGVIFMKFSSPAAPKVFTWNYYSRSESWHQMRACVITVIDIAFSDLTLKRLGHFFFKMWFYFLMLSNISVIFFIWNWSNTINV